MSLSLSALFMRLFPPERQSDPFRYREYFDEEKLKELAVNIERDGLVEPIMVRSSGVLRGGAPEQSGGYELIAGERRLRAVRDYTNQGFILARIVNVDDRQARRIAISKNLQREDLSSIETIKGTMEMVDVDRTGVPAGRRCGTAPRGRSPARTACGQTASSVDQLDHLSLLPSTRLAIPTR